MLDTLCCMQVEAVTQLVEASDDRGAVSIFIGLPFKPECAGSSPVSFKLHLLLQPTPPWLQSSKTSL